VETWTRQDAILAAPLEHGADPFSPLLERGGFSETVGMLIKGKRKLGKNNNRRRKGWRTRWLLGGGREEVE
jgi:hypothetical protein